MSIFERLREKLKEEEFGPKIEEIGQVIEVKDGVAKVLGLDDVENMELIKFEGKNILGLALNLERYETGVVILGKGEEVKEGDIVKRTKKILSVPVGEELIGRVIDPLGNPLDEKGEIKSGKFLPVERKAPSVVDREPVKDPLHTGTFLIDALIPIGRGQRELILGDRGIGKTAICLDAILNQKNEKEKPICIYVACGQKKSKIKRLIKTLKEREALSYTIVVAAFADDPASLLYLAPFAGMTIGEFFRDKGKDSLVIIDDLTKQAWAWREISLILRRPPGREAYPGDIFYLHSRLLERAAKLSQEKGGGSLTCLPIIETVAGDISGYIPTNVISICDGQIFLDSSLFHRGQKPAIDIGKSVSRVGSKAQLPAMKKLSSTLKLDLAQFEELERFTEFTEELETETKKIIEKGRKIREILKQQDLEPLSFEKEVILIYLITKGFLDDFKLEDVDKFKKEVLKVVEQEKPDILDKIKEKKDLDFQTEKEIENLILKTKKNLCNL
jgi:F-type H+-transporting ATPase subunit alpha